jgi:hypothetical protein
VCVLDRMDRSTDDWIQIEFQIYFTSAQIEVMCDSAQLCIVYITRSSKEKEELVYYDFFFFF